MDLILDTCALLSLSGIADKRLSRDCLARIQSATHLYISSCSASEIALKNNRGQLDLGAFQSPEAFWERCIEQYVLSEMSVSGKLFMAAAGLPKHHADPFDRLIIATALELKASIVTYDKLFENYRVRVMH